MAVIFSGSLGFVPPPSETPRQDLILARGSVRITGGTKFALRRHRGGGGARFDRLSPRDLFERNTLSRLEADGATPGGACGPDADAEFAYATVTRGTLCRTGALPPEDRRNWSISTVSLGRGRGGPCSSKTIFAAGSKLGACARERPRTVRGWRHCSGGAGMGGGRPGANLAHRAASDISQRPSPPACSPRGPGPRH